LPDGDCLWGKREEEKAKGCGSRNHTYNALIISLKVLEPHGKIVHLLILHNKDMSI
jgi:hypothetical protein